MHSYEIRDAKGDVRRRLTCGVASGLNAANNIRNNKELPLPSHHGSDYIHTTDADSFSHRAYRFTIFGQRSLNITKVTPFGCCGVNIDENL